MADMLDLSQPTPLLTLAGKKWVPAEPLEGRALGAVKRSLATPKTIKIVGAETSTGGMRSGSRTSGMTGMAGMAGARPRTAARSTTSRAGNGKTGAGMTTMAAGMGGATPRKRGRPRRTPIS